MKNLLRPLKNSSLRKQLLEQIRDQISFLSIAPDSPVREAELARQAGISRTPVRESLLMLEAEGFVDSRRSQGFSTKPLSTTEICEIHPIVASLECLALRGAYPLSNSNIAKLTSLNKEMKSSTNPVASLKIDEQWHSLLVAGCQNQLLKQEIGRMKALLRRYAVAFLEQKGQIDKSWQQHREIVSHLNSKNLNGAIRVLKRNWQVSTQEVVRWMRSQQSENS